MVIISMLLIGMAFELKTKPLVVFVGPLLNITGLPLAERRVVAADTDVTPVGNII
jgi:hypothetical protein